MSLAKLLIIEDDEGLQSQMRWCFDDVEVAVAGDEESAKAAVQSYRPDVVTLDLGLPPDPGGTQVGFQLLSHIRESLPETKIIVITGREERDHAIAAIAAGAYDFYQKPIEAETLVFVVARALKLQALERENATLSKAAETGAQTLLNGLVGASPVMVRLTKQVQRIAPTETTVLILGETGTGKEVIANNLHQLSDRRDGPLITINCAAIPDNLLESELFGHEKGSFTGAHARKIGKIEAADGGTLFLDEIGDMPLPLQAKILRFLQERTFERVGATQSLSANVRVLSATHRHLEEMISNGDFREDLFYRIGELSVELPPLRERGGDILLIAHEMLKRNQGDRQLSFSSQALTAMEKWAWPGNIRELENKIRRAAILAEDETITAIDLELADQADVDESSLLLKEVRAAAESTAIAKALLRSNHNISEAARLLGTSRPTLYSLIERYGIETKND